MKKVFIDLLERVQEKSGDCVAHFIMHSDQSGALMILHEEEFSFDDEIELKAQLIDYLKS
jgi:hypothetical protein